MNIFTCGDTKSLTSHPEGDLNLWTRCNPDPRCHPVAIIVFQAKLPSLTRCCIEQDISSIRLGVCWLPSPHKLWSLRSQTLSSSSCCMKLWTSPQIPRPTPPTSQHRRDESSWQHKPSLDREIMNGWTDACSSLIPLTYAGQQDQPLGGLSERVKVYTCGGQQMSALTEICCTALKEADVCL